MIILFLFYNKPSSLDFFRRVRLVWTANGSITKRVMECKIERPHRVRLWHDTYRSKLSKDMNAAFDTVRLKSVMETTTNVKIGM